MPKWERFLVYLSTIKEWRGTSIMALESNITFAHIIKLLEEFSKLGLIHKIKRGRKIDIQLTDKGLEVSTALFFMFNRINYKLNFKSLKINKTELKENENEELRRN